MPHAFRIAANGRARWPARASMSEEAFARDLRTYQAGDPRALCPPYCIGLVERVPCCTLEIGCDVVLSVQRMECQRLLMSC